MLDGHLLGDADAEEVSTETTKYNTQKSSGDSNSVSEAFEELLG